MSLGLTVVDLGYDERSWGELRATDSSRRPCLFCGSLQNRSTKEHAWPQWLINHYPKAIPTISGRFVDGKLWGGRKSDSIALVLRNVCEQCNNNWLSQLESDAMSKLTPLIDGRLSILPVNDMQLLVLWFMKTAITLGEKLHPGTIPYEHAKYVYDFRHPVDGTYMWLMKYTGSDASVGYGSVPLNGNLLGRWEATPLALAHGFGAGCYGYLATVRFRRVICQIFWSERNELSLQARGGAEEQGFRPEIFPVPSSPVFWPDATVKSRMELEALMTRFSGHDSQGIVNPVTRSIGR
jgi:hypothetical protein